jgi:activator of 2-hydroxyglutaryl-CoA dehydratase
MNQRERQVLGSVKNYVDAIETARIAAQLTHKFVQAEIDFATAGNRTVADHGLGVTIPLGAVVTRVLRKVTADLDSTSQTGTAQLYLGASSGSLNLDVALACDGASVIEGWNEQVDGTSKKPYVQTVASSAKELTVKIATNAITSTSGKIQYIVEYIIPA